MSKPRSNNEKNNKNKKDGNDNAKLDSSTPWIISDSLDRQCVDKNKHLRALVMATPWADSWEFESVGRALIHAARILPQKVKSQAEPDDNRLLLSDLQLAMRRVCVWKLRADNRLPHAIESSYQLAQCLWNDHYYNHSNHNSPFKRGAEELRLAYACVVLRSINGVADKGQQQRGYAASVSVLCAEMGVPAWLVDIRHEATHNQMPTLSVLRLAATTLLEYFYREYWVPKIKQLQSVVVTTGTSSVESNDNDADKSKAEAAAKLWKQLEDYQSRQSEVLASKIAASPAKGGSPNNKEPPTPNKSSMSNPSSSSKKRKTPTKAAVDKNNTANEDDDSDEDDDDEEVYLDALSSGSSPTHGGGGGFWSPPTAQLGTNANRFAALQTKQASESKKKKKATNNNQAATAPTPEKKPKKPKKKKQKLGGPTPYQLAKQFVSYGMDHWELAKHTALIFLVWGNNYNNNDNNEEEAKSAAAFVPDSATKFPATAEGVKKLRQHYVDLLVALGKSWPGFLSTLMIHLVDRIVLVESTTTATTIEETNNAESAAADSQATSSTNDTRRRALFFLDSWVRYMVSREFVARFQTLPPKTKATRAATAPWSGLEKMWYPLNGLCDRLVAAAASSSTEIQGNSNATSQRLADFLVQALGSNRCPNYGVEDSTRSLDDQDNNTSLMMQTKCANQDAAVQSPVEETKEKGLEGRTEGGNVNVEDGDKQSTAEKGIEVAKLSLDEVEAMLFNTESKGKEVSDRDVSSGQALDAGLATAKPTDDKAPDDKAEEAGKSPQLNQRPKRPAWVSCIAWEPCSIGALPGHLCLG